MNVLVLQSFLAVSFSSASATSLFKCSPSSQVLAPCVAAKYLNCISSKLQVYELLAPTMAEAVIVCSLDLMDSYHTFSVSSLH